MKAEELRIGNYTRDIHQEDENDGIFQVEQIRTFGDGGTRLGVQYREGSCWALLDEQNEEGLEPIPLSPEWLLKFGFVLISEAHYKFPTHRDTYDKTKIVERLDRVYKFTYEPDDIDGEDWRNIEVLQVLDPHTLKQRRMGIKKIRNRFIVADDLQYVHQLQNLYFALTGTELTLKQ